MSTRERVQELVRYVQAGRIPEAIDEFYADDASMQENRQPPTVGKVANIVREQAFADSVERWHEVSARSVAVDGDQVVIEWIFDYTTREGQRIRMEEIAQQRWRGGKIERERFFYDSATLSHVEQVAELEEEAVGGAAEAGAPR
ncbi:MAG TPA: nuclear transport factor 2 family protein [Gemmatimonadales bacterium]|jgi:ketosteroid isomerase-like protein